MFELDERGRQVEVTTAAATVDGLIGSRWERFDHDADDPGGNVVVLVGVYVDTEVPHLAYRAEDGFLIDQHGETVAVLAAPRDSFTQVYKPIGKATA